MSPDRAARAAALREQLSREEPEMFAFMESMKNDFNATVLYVKTPTVEAGTEPEPGVQPYFPLPASTWPYAVGESPRSAGKPVTVKRRRAR